MADFKIQGQGGQDADKPIPFDDGKVSISHSPLNLGGGTAPPAETEEKPVVPVVKDTAKKVSWPDRVTGCKTFYAKLHAGAIEFVDEQIAGWLRDNPGVSIKQTNTVVGDVVAKRTEPNLIVTIWY